MQAELDNADDDALVYLASVLPCLETCGLRVVCITVKSQWFASSQMWQVVDDAILRLSRGTVSRVYLTVHRDADVPSWETLPYECEDGACKQMLPKCTDAGLILRCDGQECRLHDPQRWFVQTRGTLEDLLDVLSSWTVPVRRWEITSQTTLKESVGELSQETQRVWCEISRVFALSILALPRAVRIEFCGKGLGKLFINSLEGVFFVCTSCTLISQFHRSQPHGSQYAG